MYIGQKEKEKRIHTQRKKDDTHADDKQGGGREAKGGKEAMAKAEQGTAIFVDEM